MLGMSTMWCILVLGKKDFEAFLDTNPKVKKWASEEIWIPYKGPDGKPHRYFPDIMIELYLGNSCWSKSS